MKEKLKIAVFGHKRVPSCEGGIEIVVEEMAKRMVRSGYQITCYKRLGHHVSGAEYDTKIKTEYEGICLKKVPIIEGKGLAAVSSSFFATLYCAFGKYDVVHIHAEGPALFCGLPRLFGKRVVVTVHGVGVILATKNRANNLGLGRKVGTSYSRYFNLCVAF